MLHCFHFLYDFSLYFHIVAKLLQSQKLTSYPIYSSFAVLREVENIGIRFKRDSDEYNKKMTESLLGFLPSDFVPGSEVV